MHEDPRGSVNIRVKSTTEKTPNSIYVNKRQTYGKYKILSSDSSLLPFAVLNVPEQKNEGKHRRDQ